MLLRPPSRRHSSARLSRPLKRGSFRGWRPAGLGRDTPPEIIDTLNHAVDAALVDPNLTERLADLATSATPMTPAEYGKFIAGETEKWGKIIRAGSIKAQ
jgi:tripartite-type tricarboxylate transporter receptor subunit TctC